ncbi:MAG: hypothetical protein M1835_003061, partial [Candelina submexicana]
LIPTCRRYGLDIVIHNPLAGGIFFGKYKSADKPTEGRFNDKVGKMGSLYQDRYFKDATFEALKVIEPVIEEAQSYSTGDGTTLVRTSLGAQVTNRHDGILTGVSNFDHLQANVKDLEKGPLPDEILKTLDENGCFTRARLRNIGT